MNVAQLQAEVALWLQKYQCTDLDPIRKSVEMTKRWYKYTEGEPMVMAQKKKEKDILDQILDTIDFKGLTQDEVVGQDGLIKQLTEKYSRDPLRQK